MEFEIEDRPQMGEQFFTGQPLYTWSDRAPSIQRRRLDREHAIAQDRAIFIPDQDLNA
ncbi:hypothetical protein [Tsuneonella amylolytica]|uniref:hypothetical protein n=1 Tax=Tsuneonella amylolytica TaxID=2338327 RepID=UPI0013C509AE|nr:hypothetical protein [Tsuneonella amylolytica]